MWKYLLVKTGNLMWRSSRCDSNCQNGLCPLIKGGCHYRVVCCLFRRNKWPHYGRTRAKEKTLEGGVHFCKPQPDPPSLQEKICVYMTRIGREGAEVSLGLLIYVVLIRFGTKTSPFGISLEVLHSILRTTLNLITWYAATLLQRGAIPSNICSSYTGGYK